MGGKERVLALLAAVLLLGAGRFTFVAAGTASWFYPAAEYGRDHVCAMNIEPPGTRVLVVNRDNGREATCTVIGTGPFIPGRVIDVSLSVADALGFDGLASVSVYRTSPAKVPLPR